MNKYVEQFKILKDDLQYTKERIAGELNVDSSTIDLRNLRRCLKEIEYGNKLLDAMDTLQFMVTVQNPELVYPKREGQNEI